MDKKRNWNKIFKKVKLLVLDVDGVLTRGEIIYDDKGRELKIFNVKDGLGIFLLTKLGIPAVFLTAKSSVLVERRAKDMGVSEVIGGILPKIKAIDYLVEKYKVNLQSICFIGDDLIDLGVMKKVGIPVAVKNAPLEVKKIACYVTHFSGGEGAVREVVELILKAKGMWKKLVEDIDELIDN